MIVRPKPHWFRMLFVWQGSVLPKIMPRLLVVVALGVVAVLIHPFITQHTRVELNLQPFTLVGIALAVFLGFRNNVSYDRYWEARKLWGELVIVSRSLGREVLTLTRWAPDGAEARRFLLGLAAFAYALKHQLRRSDAETELEALLPPHWRAQVLAKRFRAAAILELLGGQLGQANRDGLLGERTMVAMDVNLNRLSEVLGGCERIATTPIPMPFQVLLHRTVYLYCFLLPFGLVSTTGWLTPLFAVFISYTFITVDAIGEEIEDPFGTDANDLPLNALTRIVHSGLLEMLGDAVPPEPPVPADYIVL
jgi:putative membrane protein